MIDVEYVQAISAAANMIFFTPSILLSSDANPTNTLLRCISRVNNTSFNIV